MVAAVSEAAGCAVSGDEPQAESMSAASAVASSGMALVLRIDTT
jgi:hypothetical protein